ncbi:MAG TPA: acyltransferase [Aquabacterium sp.]|uniref:acyltransferase family protein n=1 Tax=Aquabacterium sp. TaxID=1872578 RepID=UPI002E32114A|nr:acyltransferase [Aquabacterium sp.]HEX5355806.1 acyltransferase [Aquabacterium sp.]
MKRFAALDALRGLAAASVLFAHVRNVFVQHHTPLDLTPLFLFWAGGEAVILFFVLSGMVLVQRARHGAPQPWPAFLAGRFMRVGAPHILVAVCCVIASSLTATLGLAQNHPMHWPQEINGWVVLGQLLMVPDFDNMVFNDVVWTLIHEMRFALLFPCFCLVFARWGVRSALLGLWVLSLLAAGFVTLFGDPSAGFKTSYVHTAHYLLIFGLGAALVTQFDTWRSRVLSLSASQRVWLVVMALLVYAYARMVYLIPQKLGWRELATFNAFVADWFVALAACALMLAATSFERMRNLLERRPFQYLGEVSFSLYLVHIPVMKVVFSLMPQAATLTAVVVALPLIAAVTHLFHRGVERPAQQLGRTWARHVEAMLARRRTAEPSRWLLDDENDLVLAAGSEGASHPEAAHHHGQ